MWRPEMIEISVTYTDTRMTELTFSFNEYRFKKKIEEVLKVRYQIPEDKTVLVNVEAVADNPALHHLVEQVDWGHLYDHEPTMRKSRLRCCGYTYTKAHPSLMPFAI
jgi:hypothetical protein